MLRPVRLFALILLLAAVCAQAAIFRVTGPDGKVTYTDAPPANVSGSKNTVKEVPISSYTGPAQQGSLKAQPDWTELLKRKPEEPPKAIKVVMFSAEWCGYCKQAKAYMQAKNIAFNELDIEKNASARQEYQKLGGRGVPYFVIGSRTLAGFSPDAFDATLREAGK